MDDNVRSKCSDLTVRIGLNGGSCLLGSGVIMVLGHKEYALILTAAHIFNNIKPDSDLLHLYFVGLKKDPQNTELSLKQLISFSDLPNDKTAYLYRHFNYKQKEKQYPENDAAILQIPYDSWMESLPVFQLGPQEIKSPLLVGFPQNKNASQNDPLYKMDSRYVTYRGDLFCEHVNLTNQYARNLVVEGVIKNNTHFNKNNYQLDGLSGGGVFSCVNQGILYNGAFVQDRIKGEDSFFATDVCVFKEIVKNIGFRIEIPSNIKDLNEHNNSNIIENETHLVQHTDLSNLYWVGIRMTDVENVTPFRGYIFFFGEQSHKNAIIMCSEKTKLRVDHNDYSDSSQDEFILHSVAAVLQREPVAKFMFYNPLTVYRLNLDEKYGKEHFVCLNDKSLLNQLNDKHQFRQMMQDIIPMLPVVERSGFDCDYDDLIELLKKGSFEDHNNYGVSVPDIQYDLEPRFIIQAFCSSGGSGTFVLNRENARYLKSSLDPRANYIVSVYYSKNIAVNAHVLIEDNHVTILPSSIQLEREVEAENKLLYKGADFPAYFQIDISLREQFEKQAQIVGEHLRDLGYRGVLGVDAIIHDGRVNITEVNGRFQASTELLNRSLLQAGYKTVHELNYDIFCNGNLCDSDRCSFQGLRVAYSNYSFSYEGRSFHPNHVYKQAMSLYGSLDQKNVECVQVDGYRLEKPEQFSAQAYLFRVVFSNSIASVSEDKTVWINENICGLDRWLTKKIIGREKLALKISLLIQGIRIEDSISKSLREATNNAVDLQFGDGKDLLIINSPTNIRYVEFSPFELRKSLSFPDKYCVYYYDNLLIDQVGVFPADKNQNLIVSDGKKHRHFYSEIAYLSTDRLRVHITNACIFKLAGKGCQFCNIPIIKNSDSIEAEDVKTVVETYITDRNMDIKAGKDVYLRHFLIGGQSLENCDEQLIETARVLGKYKLPIYVMTLPLKRETVEKLVENGAYEFAYNVEIFNQRCREIYMPGKSKISLDDYLSALEMTKRILNKVQRKTQNKVVRSMVIVGLEPYNDMMEGIDKLIDMKVEPMLSIFRPLPHTPLEHLNAPPIDLVYNLFITVSKKLYSKSGSRIGEDGRKKPQGFRKLGPECPCCQNNTVSLPWAMQIGKKVYTEWSLDQNKSTFEPPIEQKNMIKKTGTTQ